MNNSFLVKKKTAQIWEVYKKLNTYNQEDFITLCQPILPTFINTPKRAARRYLDTFRKYGIIDEEGKIIGDIRLVEDRYIVEQQVDNRAKLLTIIFFMVFVFFVLTSLIILLL